MAVQIGAVKVSRKPTPGIEVLWAPTPTTLELLDLSLTLDAVLSGSIDVEVDVTEHPIESGSQIADHRRPKPLTVSIEGLVTDTPFPGQADTASRRSRFGHEWFSASEAKPGTSQTALKTLQDLVNSDQLLQLRTPKGVYEDMTLQRLSIPLDPKTGQALRFTALFRQVRTVSSATVQIERKQRKVKLSIGHVVVKRVTAAPPSTSIAEGFLIYLGIHPPLNAAQAAELGVPWPPTP